MTFNFASYKAKVKGPAPLKASESSVPKVHHRYAGTTNISKTLFTSWKNSAKRRGINFKITIKQLQAIWDQQNGHCVVTGRAMTTTTNDWNKVSIDRIDSAGIYIWNNVRLICWCANMIRN